MLFLLLLACREKSGDSEDPGRDLDSADTQDSVDSEPCTTSTWYSDDDHDGFGDAGQPHDACELQEGWVTNPDDCDDTRESTHPGADEYCNHLDDDCDDLVDEDAVDVTTWYTDADGDGYGDATAGAAVCAPSDTQVTDATDCDDADGDIYPGGTEIEGDGLDDDCDGRVDEIRVCEDGSGDFDSVQAAIDAAPVDGAVIEVCPGIYYEALEISDRVLEIEGESGNPEDVLVDASTLGIALYAEGGESASLAVSGMSFTGASSGAIWVLSSGALSLTHFVVRDTVLASSGAALLVYGSDVHISDGEVRDNEAWLSGGGTFSRLMILSGGGGYFDETSPSSMVRCYVHDNGAESDGVYSAVYETGMVLSNNLFVRNHAEYGVVELNTFAPEGMSLFYNNTIVENAAMSGPVVKTVEYDAFDGDRRSYDLRNNVFCSNMATDVLMFDEQYWHGSCGFCDADHDGACEDNEAIASCTLPSLTYNWFCESPADLCGSSWCLETLSATNEFGLVSGLAEATDPPYTLPPGSPAIDGGDPATEFVDMDGTRNDPGRYGGPAAIGAP